VAYVSGYKHDIFISYPRENNRADTHGLKWVREFKEFLEVALAQRISSRAKIDIFFDEHDFEAGQNSKGLIEAARNAAIFLPIISPPYVAPGKFTLRELSAFCESRPAAEQVIVSVYFLPIDDEQHPDELQGPRRVEFYSTNEDGVEVPLKTFAHEYGSKIHTVAHQIKNRLEEMRARRDPSLREDTKGPFSGKTVLLGQVMDDLVDSRDEVREYLEKLGVAVLPQGQFPPWGPRFAEDFQAMLESADLFVQLLSKVRSEKYEVEAESCAQFQYKAASRAGKPVIQWRDPSDISKVQHYDKALLECAAAMGLEQLKTTIAKKLEQLGAPPEGDLAHPPGGVPYVYITADGKDLNEALELKKIANELGAVKIMEDDNKLKDFRKQIGIAEAVVFLYGSAPRKFVDDWLEPISKLLAAVDRL
jgi:TIR domain